MNFERFFFGPLMEQQHALPTGSGDEKKEDVVEEKDEVEDEEKDDTKSDDEPIDEEEFSDEDLANTKGLYKLLKNPATRDHTLRTLANSAGIKLADVETKQEAKAAKKSVKQILETHFPAEYKFLVPHFTGAFEEMLEQEREENKTDRDSLAATQVEQQVDRAREKLSNRTKGDSEKYWSKMNDLSGKLMPSGDMNTYEYLEHLYILASAGKSASRISQNLNDRINRNSKDAASRLHSKGQGGSGDTNEKPEMNLRKAISSALAKQGIHQK